MRLPFMKKDVPPVSHFLPLIIVVMCVGLFLMAGLVLISPHLEPKSRVPKGNVSAVSAQGFMGLRQVLEGSGITTRLNRQESGPRTAAADLVIVTLDSDGAVYNHLPEHVEAPVAEISASSSSSSSASSSSTSQSKASQSQSMTSSEAEAQLKRHMEAEASASSASRVNEEANSTSAQANPPDLKTGQKTETEDYFATPSVEKSHQILYAPQGRAVLVIAPKWEALPAPQNPRWGTDPWLKSAGDIFSQLTLLSPVTSKPVTSKKGAVGDEPAYKITYRRLNYLLVRGPTAKYRSYALSPAAGQTTITRAYTSGGIKGLQSITGPNLTPLLVGPKGEVLVSRVNPMPGDKPFKTPVYLLSDPDLMNNQMMADPERVAGALAIIRDLMPKSNTPTVVFDVTFNDLAYEQDLLHHVARPPFIAVPLALLVLALGLVWSAFSRFGPVHDPSTDTPHGRGVVVLADNAARLIAKAGREPKLAPGYAVMVRDQALKGLGFTQHSTLSADEMAEKMGEKYQTSERYSQLAAEAETIKNPMQLLTWARRLHQWKSSLN